METRMSKKISLDVLDKAYNSAPMSEIKEQSNNNNINKKKLINLPQAWEDKIKNHYKGTVNSYILMAIFERMQKDGMI